MALAEARSGPKPAGDAAAAHTDGEALRRCTEWLSRQGADLSGVTVQPSASTSDGGCGLFAAKGLRRHFKLGWLGNRLGATLTGQRVVVAAEIPLRLALTAANVVSDPELGDAISELLDLGLLDQRTAVMVALVVDRLRGEGSPRAPWLATLPHSFSTPLWFDEQQMLELRGTALARAAALQRRQLAATWQRLQPAVTGMLQQVGVETEATFDDFLWAYSVFWSRGQSLPVTLAAPPASQSDAQQTSGDGSGAASVRVVVQEGIVPGLDFCNHRVQATCWWEVADADASGPPNADTPPRPSVQLLTNRVCCPQPGEELFISYGDKGNEELLMLYGFALPSNPHDVVMIPCPLPPPDQLDDTTAARLELLLAKGLQPQVFVSACFLEEYQRRRGTATARGADPGTAAFVSCLPSQARATLEAFVIEPPELARRLEALAAGSRGAGDAGDAAVADANGASGDATLLARLGMDMAVVTTFVRLLELQLLQLEDEAEGTGPLERDVELLAAGDGAQAWRRACVVYRAGQKRLVREYVVAARRELQATLVALQRAVDVAQARAEAAT